LSVDVAAFILVGVPKPRAPKVVTTKPRRRLDAAAARELILDATEKRLIGAGPAGIRLQEVAADAGVSHPTVLHHFGSREQLVRAVVARSVQSIGAALVDAISRSTGDGADLEGIVESVATVFEQTGHARVVTWLALEGLAVDEAEARLRDVVDATHALRLKRVKKSRAVTKEDTARTVVLATLALIGGAVLGPALMQNAGLGPWPQSGVAFRRWLTRLLLVQLDASRTTG
jgi:AcrR family transcriptional regulator